MPEIDSDTLTESEDEQFTNLSNAYRKLEQEYR